MTVRNILSLVSFFSIISPSTVLLAADWYVDGSVQSSGDGRSLLTAFKAIQEGIDGAEEGDTVIVAGGGLRREHPVQGQKHCSHQH